MPPFRFGRSSATQFSPLMSELLPRPPEPPRPPTFPSLEETLIGVPSTPPVRTRGLFEDLFGGRPEALLQDALDHPEKYDSRLVMLAQDLYEKRRTLEQLTKEEQEILNLGTLEFVQFKPPTTVKTTELPPKPIPTREVFDTPEPGTDIPATNIQPYWWT